MSQEREVKIMRHLTWANLPDWLSPEEARSYLGFSRSKMYELLKSGAIFSKPYGRQLRIPKEALRPVVQPGSPSSAA